MPSIITHYCYSCDLLEIYNLNVNSNFYIFSQSHDILLYSTNKKMRIYAHMFHINKTQNYLLNLIDYIKNNNLTNNKDILSYLYGSISHYLLDSTTHPYIFYKSGYSKIKHRKIEKTIDYCFLNSTKYDIKSLFKFKASKELLNCIDYSFNKTYNLKNISKKYKKSILNYKLIYNIFYKDRFGIKLLLYKIIDKIFNSNISSLSTKYFLNNDCLNCSKIKWYNPTNKNLKYNYSFNDLYELSIKKFKIIYEKIQLYFDEEININELKEYIPNISYTTGIELSQNKRMVYFEK